MSSKIKTTLAPNSDFYAANGRFSLVDAAGSQIVNVASGASVTLGKLSGSNIFNLEGNSADFKISASSGKVTLTAGSTKLVFTLSGSDVQSLRFYDGELQVSRTGKNVYAGTQKLGNRLN